MRASLILVSFVLAGAAACISDRTTVLAPDGTPCSVPGAVIEGKNALVLVRGFAFLPDTVHIQRGMAVTWVNCEAPSIPAHTSTSETDVWNSGLFEPGETYTQAFNTAGTFSYLCQPHPTMRGVVIVH